MLIGHIAVFLKLATRDITWLIDGDGMQICQNGFQHWFAHCNTTPKPTQQSFSLEISPFPLLYSTSGMTQN